MIKKTLPAILLYLLTLRFSNAQSIGILREKINQALEGRSATVGVAISGIDSKDTLSINGSKCLPMQSVFNYVTSS